MLGCTEPRDGRRTGNLISADDSIVLIWLQHLLPYLVSCFHVSRREGAGSVVTVPYCAPLTFFDKLMLSLLLPGLNPDGMAGPHCVYNPPAVVNTKTRKELPRHNPWKTTSALNVNHSSSNDMTLSLKPMRYFYKQVFNIKFLSCRVDWPRIQASHDLPAAVKA